MKKKLIYIVGLGRSGSTLLGNRLQTLGYGSFVCELFWWVTHEQPRNDSVKCSCNNTVQACEFWSKIDIQDNILDTGHFANRNLWTFLNPGHNGLKEDSVSSQKLINKLLHEFESPIIETSKSPIIARFLKHIYKDEIFIIKTKRPIRQIVKSWKKPKGPIPARNPIAVILEGLWYNTLMYYMKMRNEIDLELDIDEILALEDIPLTKFNADNLHAISGNPSR